MRRVGAIYHRFVGKVGKAEKMRENTKIPRNPGRLFLIAGIQPEEELC